MQVSSRPVQVPSVSQDCCCRRWRNCIPLPAESFTLRVSDDLTARIYPARAAIRITLQGAQVGLFNVPFTVPQQNGMGILVPSHHLKITDDLFDSNLIISPHTSENLSGQVLRNHCGRAIS